MSTETHNFTWQGIDIELTYEPNAFGGSIAHLQVRSINPDRAPLAITDSGYRSHFHPVGNVEAGDGTIIEQVTAWLDEEAKSRKWQIYLVESRQLSLF